MDGCLDHYHVINQSIDQSAYLDHSLLYVMQLNTINQSNLLRHLQNTAM